MISPARLFNTRYRGFRVVDIAGFAVLATLVLGVYGVKALAGREGAQIAGIDQQIAAERQDVRLLKAELAHLEQPTRMVRLSTDYLGLEPISAKRESAPEGLTQIALNPTPSKSAASAKATKTAAAPKPAPATGAAATPTATAPAGSDPQ